MRRYRSTTIIAEESGPVSNCGGLQGRKTLLLANDSLFIYSTGAFLCMLCTNYQATYLIIFSYSLSFPFESLQRLYITDESTFAGLNVLGSFNSEITESKIVLKSKQSW